MPMEHVDVAVVGGGVTGLAVAIAVAERGRSVCLLERHPRPGMESSTHNSGVIHAGIYYEQGSLRATLCVEGRDRLYTFRRAHDVPHERCGTLIVAFASNETARLHELARCARANGVDDVERVGRDFVRPRTPHVEAMAALWSPSTGIVEAEALVRALARRAAELDVMLLPGTRLEHGTPSAAGVDVVTSSETFSAGLLVNAAGLYADDVSAAVGGERFAIQPVRGECAELVPRQRYMVNIPVYPVPDPSGYSLGVHLTRTTWGSVMIGPTARSMSTKDDHESDRVPLEQFYQEIRRFLPSVQTDDLRRGGTGFQATLSRPDEPVVDFLIRPDRHCPQTTHAVGIDSQRPHGFGVVCSKSGGVENPFLFIKSSPVV